MADPYLEPVDHAQPPQSDLQSVLDSCVHCGFCLPACPTYVLWGREEDSPRGRIRLMIAVADEDLDPAGAFGRHIDACLGCLGCVTACPSGVQYGALIEAARVTVETEMPRGRLDRAMRELLFALFPHPTRLRLLVLPLAVYGLVRPAIERLGIVRRLPGRLRAFAEMAPSVTLSAAWSQLPVCVPPRGGVARARVGLLTGCVQQAFFADVNSATVRVLSAEGCEVVIPRRQGCCGALGVHAGRREEARQAAREIIEIFDRANVDYVVTNAAGCGSTLKEYGQLLADDPSWAPRARALSARARDISELLAELGPSRNELAPVHARVAYQDACHLRHAQGIQAQPRAMLAAIPGLDLLPIREADLCCGSAGVYNLVQPETGRDLGERKVAAIAETSPDLVASANPGCAIQIGAIARSHGHSWRVVHPIQLVDASIRGDASFDRAGRA